MLGPLSLYFNSVYDRWEIIAGNSVVYVEPEAFDAMLASHGYVHRSTQPDGVEAARDALERELRDALDMPAPARVDYPRRG